MNFCHVLQQFQGSTFPLAFLALPAHTYYGYTFADQILKRNCYITHTRVQSRYKTTSLGIRTFLSLASYLFFRWKGKQTCEAEISFASRENLKTSLSLDSRSIKGSLCISKKAAKKGSTSGLISYRYVLYDTRIIQCMGIICVSKDGKPFFAY